MTTQETVPQAEKEPMRAITVDLPASLAKAARVHAANNDTTVSALVRQGLRNILEIEDSQPE